MSEQDPSTMPPGRKLDRVLAVALGWRVERQNGSSVLPFTLIDPHGLVWRRHITEEDAWFYLPNFSQDDGNAMVLLREQFTSFTIYYDDDAEMGLHHTIRGRKRNGGLGVASEPTFAHAAVLAVLDLKARQREEA